MFSFPCLFVYWVMYLFLHLFTYSFTSLFSYLCIYLFIYGFIHSLTYLFTHFLFYIFIYRGIVTFPIWGEKFYTPPKCLDGLWGAYVLLFSMYRETGSTIHAFPHRAAFSSPCHFSPSNPRIPLSSFLSNILDHCPSLDITDQGSHPYKIRRNVYITIHITSFPLSTISNPPPSEQ